MLWDAVVSETVESATKLTIVLYCFFFVHDADVQTVSDSQVSCSLTRDWMFSCLVACLFWKLTFSNSPSTPLPCCPPSDSQRLWFSIITELARVIKACIIILISKQNIRCLILSIHVVVNQSCNCRMMLMVVTCTVTATGDDFQVIQQEIQMMRECQHPNIVAYYGSYLRYCCHLVTLAVLYSVLSVVS